MSKPTHNVFVSEQNQEGKSFYTKVGAAWEVANGGLSLDVKLMPRDGKLVIFPVKENQNPAQ